MEDISRAARVAAPTVYAAVGGKSGLLRTLIEDGVRAAEAGGIYERIAAQTDPGALLRLLVDGTRSEVPATVGASAARLHPGPTDGRHRRPAGAYRQDVHVGSHRRAGEQAPRRTSRCGDRGAGAARIWVYSAQWRACRSDAASGPQLLPTGNACDTHVKLPVAPAGR
ncbi:hypothetical protein ACIGYR_37125 [Streptomyces sp. NPDC053076]|uniref:hypothetical protein n=1 Tax=Streptomyces sp. NPDC053076 TaxID=3365696 RepID=UPI0037D59944